MITLQTYALLALQVYKSSSENTFDLPSQWVQLPQPTGTYGFAYAVYKNTATNEIVISYRGTDNDFGDWATNFGVTFAQEAQAAEVYARVLRDYGVDTLGSNISFTGHSLGGGLAASMAVWFNRPATVFDPAPSESLSKDMTVLRRVEINLGNNIPAAFSSYLANIAAQFAVREANVTSYAAPGSIVYAGNFEWNVITGNGQNNQVLFGIQNMGGISTGMVQMHSQALLTAGILVKDFADATIAVQTALPLIMSEHLYALPTTSADRNLLIDLIRSEQTAPGLGKLSHFAADLNKLGTTVAGLSVAAQNAIIAQGIEWYYWQSNNYGGQEFFTQSGNLLQYTTAQGAGLSGAQNKANLYTNSWLATLNSAYGLAYMPIIKTDYQQWNVNGGINAVTATAKDNTKTQIFIGQAGSDTFTGGNKDDVFFAGGGADTLEGGLGNDSLYGGDGADTYKFSGNFGLDTVLDSDGLGSIQLDGITLGTAKGAGKRNVWLADLGNGQYAGLAVYDNATSSTGKRLVITRAGDTNNTITIDNFDLNISIKQAHAGDSRRSLGCSHHRKQYKKHSKLGHKYAGYSQKRHYKWLNIAQADSFMKEIRV